MNDQINKIMMEARDKAFKINTKYFTYFSSSIFLGFISYIIYNSFQYSSETRLVPLLIAIPTFLLILLNFVNTHTNIYKYFSIWEMDSTTEIHSSEITDVSSNNNVNNDILTRRSRTLIICGWIILLFLLVAILGFHPTILIFMALFYRFEAGMSWKNSLVYTIVQWTAIVLIFNTLLDIEFYRGFLEINIFHGFDLILS